MDNFYALFHTNNAYKIAIFLKRRAGVLVQIKVQGNVIIKCCAI